MTGDVSRQQNAVGDVIIVGDSARGEQFSSERPLVDPNSPSKRPSDGLHSPVTSGVLRVGLVSIGRHRSAVNHRF